METTAIVRGVRLSAQKGRLVADLVRGKPVDKALNILRFTQKRAAGIILKALESAIANAEHTTTALTWMNCSLRRSTWKRPRRCAASVLAPRVAVRVSASRRLTSL